MGNIPVINIIGKTIPEAWEKAVLAVWEQGARIKTQYDKPEDPASRDATAIVTVDNPFAEPRIHKNFPGGPEELESYRQEVIAGIHDHWINPEENKWTYTYHERLFDYSPCEDLSNSNSPRPFASVDQIQYIIDYMAKSGHTRRAQAITWQPTCDPQTYDPPCFCAGTKILTPNGTINIEDLENGDSVWAYDLFSNKLVIDTVSKRFRKNKPCVNVQTLLDTNIKVSSEQLLMTSYGWVKAQNLTVDDSVKITTILDKDVSDMMIVGMMHGDAWLSNRRNRNNKETISGELHFSAHPDADIRWLMRYLHKNTKNKIKDITKFIKSKVVPEGGFSRKISVSDKKIWEKFYSLGCVVGSKKGQEIRLKADDLTDDECKDFLTGIYSAEGCVYLNDRASIQIGMNWEQCISFVEKLLKRFSIEYTKHIQGKTHKLYISKNKSLISSMNVFDFSMDSRKQAKWLKLRASINYSFQVFDERTNQIKELIRKKESGQSMFSLRKESKFNNRIFKPGYAPVFRLYVVDIEIGNNYVMVPVKGVSDLGELEVFDFEVNHIDHAIVANNIISHNCLQRIWCRMIDDEEGNPVLNMNTHWRSRDLYQAWFMNAYALTDLQRIMAEKISEKIGKTVKVGRYVDISDSLHLYGSYLNRIEAEIKKMEENPIHYGDLSSDQYTKWYRKKIRKNLEQRTYRTDHPAFKMMTEEARENLKIDPDFYSKGDK